METYQTNHGAKYRLSVHLVWCPKYRRPVLTENIASRLKELIHETAQSHEWEIIALEVVPDHIHLLIAYDPYSSVSYVANQIKGASSRILRQEFPELKSKLPTLWSRSYFASSVGMNEAAIAAYVETQRERPWRRNA